MSVEARVRQLEARVAELEQRIGLASAGPKRTPAPERVTPVPRPAREDLESRLATTWLNRVGIVALVGGIALLLVYAFPGLGAAGKLASGYVCAVGLAGLGLHLRRRHRLFGQVLFAGGMALLYFDTYALHFVPGLRIIDSPVLTLVLMSLLVVGIVWAAQRMASEGVAGIALFLGYATAVIAQTTAFTLVSLALLGGASIALLVMNRWVVVPVSSVVAVYVTHLLWMLGYPAAGLATAPSGACGVSLGALCLYFAIFAAAPLIGRGPLSATVQLLLGGLNWLGLLTLGLAEVLRHDAGQVWVAGGVLAAVMAGLAALASRRPGREVLVELQGVLAVITLAVALAAGLAAGWIPLGWAVAALALVLVARRRGSLPLLVAGLSLALLAAALQLGLLTVTALPAPGVVVVLLLLDHRLGRDGPVWRPAMGVTLVLAAVLLLLATLAAVADGEWVTLCWLATALALFTWGLVAGRRLHRLAALGVLGIALLKVVIYDLSQLAALVRIASVVLLGLVLLLVSYLYTRLESRLRREPPFSGSAGPSS